ncbi:MAG TPA: carboxylesterase [Nevskiales bacterium]|nr:carboxylesterase [Nevskiales bacterium]
MISELDCVELEPGSPARASVIWLHGLGADGNDFVPIVPELRLPDSMAVRFVFPHAPIRPVTLNGGMRMRAWYDILGLDRALREDEAGLRESQAQIEALIRRENARGISSARIVLAGFSQGGAITLQTGLRYPEKLAGLMVLSSYLPLRERFAAEASAANRSTPIFMAHGEFDYMLPLQLGSLSRDLLQQNGYAVEWHAYPMEHQVCLEEIRDIAAWLRKVLA